MIDCIMVKSVWGITHFFDTIDKAIEYTIDNCIKVIEIVHTIYECGEPVHYTEVRAV